MSFFGGEYWECTMSGVTELGYLALGVKVWDALASQTSASTNGVRQTCTTWCFLGSASASKRISSPVGKSEKP